jgi:hypothetical protein
MSPAFYRLSPSDRVLFLQGMPIEYIKEKTLKFDFRNEQLTAKLLTKTTQIKVYEQFLTSELGDPGLSIFNSEPTDYESLAAACQIIKTQYENKQFKDFQFVYPEEKPPVEVEEIKSVYVLMGCNSKDDNLTHHIRRWVRSRLGCSIWVCMGGEKPYDWALQKLGIKPQFLFSLKSVGISVG